MERWEARQVTCDEGQEWKRYYIADEEGHGIATVDAVGKSPEHVEQKAVLMAAAPDLLAACEIALEAVSGVKDNFYAVGRATAADRSACENAFYTLRVTIDKTKR